MIVPVRGDTDRLVERIAGIRAAGDAPLVGDPRWPEDQWRNAVAAVSQVPAGSMAAWAALTSGSSAHPRIVLRSEASWAESFDTVAELLDAGADDAVLLPAPPAASLTLFSLAHALGGGPRPVLAGEPDAEVTCLHGTPNALREVLDRGVPPRLRTALIGGSRLDAMLRERAEAAGIRLVAYYGAAELSFVAVDRGDGLVPFPGVDLEIRDGVVWVRSPFVADGYAGAAGPLRRDGAWATVGDRGELVDGRLHLHGRTDGAILSASATIMPDEVEEALRTIPGVRDAIVFARPHPRIGALLAAFVEFDGEPVANLAAAAAQLLAPAHRPRLWFSGALPRTASGKPARAAAIRAVDDGTAVRHAR
ncbi:AMP-binding protein [Microbacterium sp. bgisy189]|uniref:AMP-binding protein n=1 Tax=Microbacterium sp. bgisy189 TaxID=3413798 RepID=UPI003EBF9D32